MPSSPSVTLFTHNLEPTRRPFTIVLSALIHVGVGAIVMFGFIYVPKLDTRAADHYMVRKLELTEPDLPPQRAAKGIEYPVPKPSRPSTASKAAPRSAMRQVIQAKTGAQTILQPDLPQRLAQAENIPIPQVFIWTPRHAIVKNIVAPTPQQPTAAEVRPKLEAPNAEIHLSDVELASSPLPSQKLQVVPSTTSPVIVHGTNLIQTAPSTVSQDRLQPTPTALLSLSDMTMKTGTVTLPPMNETVKAGQSGDLTPGPADGKGSGGDGKSLANGAGNEGQPNGATMGPGHGADTGALQGNLVATRITLPKDGQFSAVVVGNAIQDQYPEMASAWGGRMAYTVYLHVGLSRSWILQYSLPRNSGTLIATHADRLDAPWPYNIVRPDLAAGAINADALMVHGFVNELGQFDALSFVFPRDFTQAQFVLSSLSRWQFRPALYGGKPARVEVLLIIPEELN